MHVRVCTDVGRAGRYPERARARGASSWLARGSVWLRMDPILGGLDARPLGAPASYAWAYRDFLDDTLAVLSVVQ
ncbi:hypothetical protein CRG98_015287 [Punica granatum]|uniref:Uncharacterized protein n=1 Tax=Punica granatum TaxID=22663 RepID=A0A2I0K713_PUNGR|nr:hypothetical protein CRG98_015287 [Punica granatum]